VQETIQFLAQVLQAYPHSSQGPGREVKNIDEIRVTHFAINRPDY
jgi:hypothetical protein